MYLILRRFNYEFLNFRESLIGFLAGEIARAPQKKPDGNDMTFELVIDMSWTALPDEYLYVTSMNV
jgi:hypothetical protein